MVVTLDEQASRRHGHLPCRSSRSGWASQYAGGMVFNNICGAMDIAPSATKVNVTSSIWKRRTDACSLSWPIVPSVTYAPSCDCYGEASHPTIIAEFPINGGIVVSSDNRCAAMGAE
jgi:hypothetical protein